MVDSKNVKQSYHHGDLRAALVEAGLRLVAERDAAPGLREVARAVGVSATAVYRHFPDKDALLAALAREGLDRLGAAQAAAAEAAGGGARGFAATGKAYVRFALANPALFRMIFACVPGAPRANLTAQDDSATLLLRENAMRVAGGEGAAARVVALRAWSLVHGLALLMLDGLVEADDALVDAVLDGGSADIEDCGAAGGR